MKINDIDLKWLGHSGFLIALESVPSGRNSQVLYIDPYKISDELPKADIILITHGHYDHCSVADIEKIVKEGTKIVVTADCQSKITRFNVPIKLEVAEPGSEFVFGNIKISAIPAYNIDKHFHPKENSFVGYLIKITDNLGNRVKNSPKFSVSTISEKSNTINKIMDNDVLIYHAGDTDIIPEMQKLTGYKQSGVKLIALLPCGGRFTMDAEEAAEAAAIIKPDLAIPMHWGEIIGSADDAKEFVELCEEEGVEARVLEKV